ncbi:PadR family transcriptional regulator [Porphyromonadaceae bacterium W3.11]|nr:PadR family transcriptional regulator [Porphyromonadaceae bacterium W3.11]
MKESLMKTKSQMRKGIMEYAILLILKHRKAYSADLLDILKENDLIVVEGTLYPLLIRMKKEGFIEYSWMESTLGPPRKYYFITEEGEALLGDLRKLWVAMRDSIDSLDVDNPEWKERATREGIRLSSEETVVNIATSDIMSFDSDGHSDAKDAEGTDVEDNTIES